MGLSSLRIYLDSCVIIYLVEEHPLFSPYIEIKIGNISSVEICTSDLAAMECMIMPLRNGNHILSQKFRNWFDGVDVSRLNKDVFQNAARLRADFPALKTPDALHLAAAIYHGCDEFWTNDDRLGKVAPNIVKNVLKP